MKSASIGVVAHLGWAATAVITVEKQSLRILRTDRIETADSSDREAMEPFHLAGGFEGLARGSLPANPNELLQRGLRKQRKYTSKALSKLDKLLGKQDYQLSFAAILVSRGRSATTIEKALSSHIQIHIEEGNAVRESFRIALDNSGVLVHDIDRKTVTLIAAEELSGNEAKLDSDLAVVTPENGGKWTKEEKVAALAAWISWVRCRALPSANNGLKNG